MKNLMLAAMMLLAGVSVEAGTMKEKTQLDLGADQTKVSVRPEDLPEAVKSALAGDGYADWKITNAYLVTRDNNSQYYEVNIKKGEETATLNLDKYGKKVD
ncbi:hypothetical protein [Dyadobacter sp. CY323]|uniref:hypothetical protein n=1 Tax=Dyadobacter sp. CY323 TaxID=2907302 RepID=UPI001F33BC85|nr:hypothetical protein [Dyadobacter sp. CY323]MCE6992301.1 hypothetical protein [Dyadobacter sp. CY323]